MTDDREKTQPQSDPSAGREETFQTGTGLVATAFGQTDVGCQRSVNQDTLGNRIGAYAAQAPEFGLLYALADGMGGHARGEVASALAVEQLFARYYGSPLGDDPRRTLTSVLIATNSAVYQAGRDAGGASMGTTLTMILLHGNTCYVGNIGDSRTYCIRGGQIEQLTHDHSLIGEQVRNGLLTEAQAKQSSIRNVITRAVGYRDEVVPDVFTYPVAVGDIILLCSDGLHSMVENQELAQAFSTQPLSAAVPLLIDLAKQRGGPDNITALAVRVDKLGATTNARDDATTAPFGQSLNDAVTKPLMRVDEQTGQAGVVTTGSDVPPARPVAMPPATPPTAPPTALKVPPIPPPPTRSKPPSRFPVAFLVILPLVLLAGLGAAFVALSGDDESPASGTVLATEPTASVATVVLSASPFPTTQANPTIPARTTPVPNVAATSPGAAARTPATSAAVIGQPTPPLAVAPAATGTTIGGSEPGPSGTTLLLLNGTIVFQPPLNPSLMQAVPSDWEVVIYSTSAFPAGFPERPTDTDLAGVPPIWRGAITSTTNGASFNYEVRGEWTLTTEQGGMLVALRHKTNPIASCSPKSRASPSIRDSYRKARVSSSGSRPNESHPILARHTAR